MRSVLSLLQYVNLKGTKKMTEPTVPPFLMDYKRHNAIPHRNTSPMLPYALLKFSVNNNFGFQQLSIVVRQRRSGMVGAMDATTIDDHYGTSIKGGV